MNKKSISVKGIVVGESVYGDSSKILKVFTKELGVISIMSRGCKKTKSALHEASNKLVYATFNINYKEDGISSGGEHTKGSYQTIEQLITVEPYVEGRNTPYKTFEVVFTPNSTYSYFTLQLNKIAYDYKANTGSRADTFIIPEGCVDFDEQGDVCIINNIFTNTTATKIGVQSRPGTLLCINREAIRIGRSGTYEINNGMKINVIGVAAPNEEIPDFILDYAWEEE